MRVHVSTFVNAPIEIVAAIYADYENWPRLFPTIRAVRVLRQDGQTAVLAIDHVEGPVVNELTVRWPGEIELAEVKGRYDARFFNRFIVAPGGTQFSVDGDIRLKGYAKFLRPFLAGAARRLIWRLQVTPVKREAEARARQADKERRR